MWLNLDQQQQQQQKQQQKAYFYHLHNNTGLVTAYIDLYTYVNEEGTHLTNTVRLGALSELKEVYF